MPRYRAQLANDLPSQALQADQRHAPRGAGADPARTRQRRPLLARKRVFMPLLFLLTIGLTIAALWLGLPVTDILTGKRMTRGEQIGKTMQNMLNPQASLVSAFNGQQQVRILLVGLDHVPEDKGETASHRSDSVMLAAADLETKQIRVVSIPRDSWIEQYQDGVAQGHDKLAHSFIYGGVGRTSETVSNLIGLPIDYYVTIKFEGLAGLVDALGGLEVDVEKNMNYDDRHGNLHIHFKKGLQMMTGKQVVEYARFRHDATGDIGRMGRQQKVIQLILDKMQEPQNIIRLGEIVRVMQQNVETSLSIDQLFALAQHAKEFKTSDIKTLTLNSFCNMGKGAVDAPGVPRGMSVQVVMDSDVTTARQFLEDLSPPPPPAPVLPEGTPGAVDGVALDGAGGPTATDEAATPEETSAGD